MSGKKRYGWIARCVLGLALVLSPLTLSAEEPPAKPISEAAPKGDDIQNVSLVVNGVPYNGALIPPPTDTDFKFKLADTGDVLSFRWASLDPAEIRRIQKLFGVDTGSGGELVWGKEVEAVRLTMKHGKTYEGVEDPDRAPLGFLCLRTKNSTAMIQAADVDKKDKITKRESEVYSADEVYERLIQEKPPDSGRASDHIELAQVCANMGLYTKAIDHLEMAKAIDPKSEERTVEFRKELLVKHSEQQARKLYQSIIIDVNSGDNTSAVEKIARFKNNFPNSDYGIKVDNIAPKITEASKADLAKKVIFMYYTQISETIQERLSKKTRVDANGKPVPVIPGKQITTKQNRIMRGTIVSEDADKMSIDVDGLKVAIMRRDVLAITDVDLSQAVRSTDATFSELKQYVTDKNGGLTKAIETKISQNLKIDPNVVKKIWAERRNQEGTYNPDTGAVEKTAKYSSQHIANFGKGSWLQDGVKQMKIPQTPGQNNQNNQRRTGGQNGGQQVPGGQPGQNADDVPPEMSDDPDLWWTVQSNEVRFDLLKALAADKLFYKKATEFRKCPTCGAEGFIRTINSSGGGEPIPTRCPTCRGLRNLTTIIFE